MNRVSIHRLAEPCSSRTAWLLTELAIDFEIQAHDSSALDFLPAHAIFPSSMGRSAVLEVDGALFEDAPTTLLWIAMQYSGRLPVPAVGTLAFSHYLRMLHFAEGFPDFKDPAALAESPEFSDRLPRVRYSLDDALLLLLDQVELALASHSHVAGRAFTAADIQVACFLRNVATIGVLEDREKLLEYLERMEARPAFRQLCARNVPACAACDRRDGNPDLDAMISRLSGLLEDSEGYLSSSSAAMQ